MMFVRGTILDGAAGTAYCNLQAIYEYMIVLKTRELRRMGTQESSLHSDALNLRARTKASPIWKALSTRR
jgi:hypothetical protein